MKTEKFIESAKKYILVFVAAFFVLFVLPEFSSPFIVPKEIFAAILISVALILSLVRSIIKGKISFSTGKFDLAILLLTASYILSAILRTPNKMEAFFFPGTVTFIILSASFYFLVNQLDKKSKSLILISLFISGVLLSIMTLLAQLGLFAKIPFLGNPAGGNLPSAIYLLAILPVGIVFAIKEKDSAKRIFLGVSCLLIILAEVFLAKSLLPGHPQALTLPTPQTAWEVAAETLKVSPLLGAGPDNYITAFNLYRSATYNQTNLWQVRFSTANNFYFTLITETGFVGLLTLIILLFAIYRSQKTWEEIPALVLLIMFLIFPGTPVLIFLLMAALSVFSKSEEKNIGLMTGRLPAVIVAVPVLAGIIALSFFGTKAVSAEITYKKSLDALTQNNAKETYNLMIAATNESPYVDRYHASLAQVNMALATSLASNKNLTDTDRTNITQLVQQAINEGKATVTLNPGRVGNWEILGQIYESIMSYAQGADQFTVQAFSQAVALDPINPNLRIELGGVYYALLDYDSAIATFKLAVLTKPDLANAHYNLAIAYRGKKDYDNAITEINTVISLVAKDSADYNLAESTLADLQKNKPVAVATKGTGSLTTPQKQTTTVNPPITLPQ